MALNGQDALAELQKLPVDCVILDPQLPDMSTAEFMQGVGSGGNPNLPVVLYRSDGDEDAGEPLGPWADQRVVRSARSLERLLDDTMLFLHRPPDRLAEPQRRMIEKLHDDSAMLSGRSVLIVDDDPRNVFALTSLLERNGMNVLSAETGMEALHLLGTRPGVDIVLMDIMMPDMDGYQTIRAIRGSPDHRTVPVIALTAKAMKGDREKCVEAGASDYIAKPADPAQLLAALRAWLHR
jgi:CheY-like chemotaxis protein